MIRTSIILPPALHQQLVMTAELENKTLSDLVRELLSTAMSVQRRHHYQHVYAALRKIHGKGDPAVTDASATINETLYGESGAWKGRDEEQI